jgi:hypothetical protein
MSAWVEQIFSARIVGDGGVVRRSISDVNQNNALEEIIEIAKENDFHVIETGEQVIILCNPGYMKVHC